MQLSFAKKVGFHTRKTNVSVYKIDNNRHETFKMVIAFFLVNDKDRRFQFFEKNFLLPDMSMHVALVMSFLILGNVQINFSD